MDEIVEPTSSYEEMKILLAMLLAAVAPFLLIFVEQLIPNAALAEETTKLLILLYLVKNLGKSRVRYWQVLLVGLLFALTETVLFIMNAFMVGSVEQVVYRLLFTVPMHTLTPIIMFTIGRRGRLWWLLGLLLAIYIHAGFNNFVSLYY